MGKEITIHPAIDLPTNPGPAMSKLNDRQQAFVVAMLDFGGRNNTRAARAAGYQGGDDGMKVIAYRLAHDENILAAIKEEGTKRLNSATIMAVNTLLDIADSETTEPKDKLKAIEMILNRTGLHATTEHKVAVTHKDESDAATIKRIEMMAKNLGIDPGKLLGTAYIEAEFEEIKPEDDLSDILGLE